MEEGKSNIDIEPKLWYAMSPIYFQETKIKRYLDEKSIRNYLPTKTTIIERNNKMKLKISPIVNSLIFIYTTESELKEICKVHPHLHYKYDRTGGKSHKMTIPENQMENFIRVCTQEEQGITFFNPKEMNLDLEKGTPIRLHSPNPILNGIEGLYVKIAGKRDKRLVVSLNGLQAVAMMVEIDWIERI